MTMADVFRITDRFNICGKGTLYTLKNCTQSDIHIGDILYDLNSNRFKVRDIELIKRIRDGVSIDDVPLGLSFELIDGVEAEGNMLVTSLSDINFLFCNHPLYPKRVDEDYEGEFQAASRDRSCALFSYENLENGELSLYGDDIYGLTVYRGWMMKPEMYRLFYDKLEAKGIILINTPEEYERYHMLPGWYEDFKEFTARSLWEDKGSLSSAMEMTKGLTGPYIVKDYVKSRKHEWYDACFIPEIDDRENAEKIIGNFLDRQGDDLVGGVVLRKYENLKQIGFHEKSRMPISEEYRLFIFAGKIIIMDDYWQADKGAGFNEDELAWLNEIAKKVKSNFVTIDIARREDGRLIIMELGDGQVSGLQQIKADDFYSSL